MAFYAQPTIKKLGARNYSSWARDIKFMLIDRNCWNIVTGDEVKPEDPALQTEYESRARVALSVIYMNIEENRKDIIQDTDTAKQAWDKLKARCEPDNRSQHMISFSEFCHCRMGSDETIDIFSARLKFLFNKFTDFKQPIPETYLTFQFLRYLPDEFESVVQYILRWKDSEFTYDKVVRELIDEESRLKLKDLDFQELSTKDTHQAQLSGWKNRPKSTFRKKDSKYAQRPKRSPSRVSPIPPRKSETANPRSRPRRRKPLSDRRRVWNRSPSSQSSVSSDRGNDIYNFYTVASLSTSNAEGQNDSAWLFDSASSHHFARDFTFFRNYEPISERMTVAVEGSTFPIKGRGNIDLQFKDYKVTLNNVLHVPKLRRNLISGAQLDMKGGSFLGKDGEVRVSLKDATTLFKAKLKDGVYYTYPKVLKGENYEASSVKMMEWHRKFAHLSPDLIVNTSNNNSVRGLPKLKHKDFFCEDCRTNKQRRVSFKSKECTRSSRPLELLVIDLWGPAPYKGRNGENYFLSIIDEYSRKAAVYPIRSKDQAFEVFKKHVERSENFLETKVKSVRSDNGREFDNRYFRSYFEKKGISPEYTNVYTPEENGIAERFNQTIINAVRTILNELKLSKSFWPDAALYFTYTWNRICHKGQTKTPFELYCGNKPSVRHLKPFGVTAYVGVPKQKRANKFVPKSKKGFLIGYSYRTRGYRIWLPEDSRVVETINVSFKDRSSDLEVSRSGAVMGSNNNSSDVFGDCNLDRSPPQPSHVFIPREQLPENSGISTVSAELGEGSGEKPSSSEETPVSDKEPRIVSWVRKPKTRPDGNRTDIFYYEEGKDQTTKNRLRSLNDVTKYCQANNIRLTPELFDFSGKNLYKGLVRSEDQDLSASNSETEYESGLDSEPESI